MFFSLRMARRRAPVFCSTAWLACTAALAQSAGPQAAATATEPIVHLRAGGQVELEQDWLLVALSARVLGQGAAEVQERLQKTVTAALERLQKDAQAPHMQVSSGNFSVQPHYVYGDKGSRQRNGWQGQAQIVLQGSDFARIGKAAAQVDSMPLARLQFSLSPGAQERAYGQARKQAVAQFRQDAADLAQGLGFERYRLQEMTVIHPTLDEDDVYYRAKATSAQFTEAGPELPAAIPAQADRTTVQVVVSGSIRLLGPAGSR